MADTFYNLDEAAKQLKVSPEKLSEMRENGEIRGFRDGSTWKFKTNEVEKLLGDQSPDDDWDLLDSGNEDSTNNAPAGAIINEILDGNEVSDEVTMLGEAPDQINALDDGPSELGLQDEDDEVTMLGEAPDLAAMLDDDEDDSESSADIGAAASLLVDNARENSGASVIGDGKSGSGPGGSDLELSTDSNSDAGSAAAEGDSVLDDSGLQLQENGGTGEINVSEEEAEFGFDAGDMADSSGDVNLSDDDFALSDDDLVLSTSDSAGNSDITLGSGDSGINLGSPSDSGISLDEEPLELAGGSSSALGLPEDESGISLGDDLSDSEDFVDLQKDDEFLLSPSDEGFGDSSDSGSQVIALSDSQAFDEDAATMIQDGMFEEDPLGDGQLLEADGMEAIDPAIGLGEEVDPTLATAALGMQPQVLAPIQAAEASYSMWNLMGLSLVLLLLLLTGISMIDLVRNMWSWEGDAYASNNATKVMLETIRDFFISIWTTISGWFG